MYLRRFDGSVPFSRPWAKYKSGFGKQGDESEFWLGNEVVYQLVKQFKDSKGKLRIEGTLFNGSSCDVTSHNFYLGDEAHNYKMHFDTVTSSCGRKVADNWVYHKNQPFATNDRALNNTFCFQNSRGYNGGWWYHRCHHLYLTGLYPKGNATPANQSMYISDLSSRDPLQNANILFQPMDTTRACDNPCAAGGTCEYLEATNSHHCVCPVTHCGATCEKVNPCKYSGTCVYSAETKELSCACIGGHTGTYCDADAQPEPEGYTFIAGVGLLVLISISAIVIASIMIKKKRRAEEEEIQALEEAERQRLLQAELQKKKDEEGFFHNLFSSGYL